MPPNTPPWVVKDLSTILGLDDETIKQMIIPDLESYTHEAGLRVHLQDFLGSSSQSQSFINRYISFRFPSLPPTQSRPHSQSLTPNPSSLKPQPSKSKSKALTPLNLSRPTSTSGSSRTKPPANNIPEALEAAFGPGGKVYQKKDLDESGFGGWGKSTGGTPKSGGGGGSGTQTPSGSQSQNQRVRQAGAINIQIQEPKAQQFQPRLDVPSSIGAASGSGSAAGSRTSSSKGKNRAGEEKIWDKPKSKAVKRLEGIVDKLRIIKESNGEGKIKDDKSISCFCQARVHPLSPYTPICQSCGLTLCNIQQPYLPCPSCSSPLSTPAQISRLILRLESEIEHQLSKEEIERQQMEQERLERLAVQAGGGSFPSLPGQIPPQSIVTTNNQGRKVISIGSRVKGKSKITTTTYIPKPPTPSTPKEGREGDKIPDDIVPRLRYNPIDKNRLEKELNKLSNYRKEHDRPYGDPKLLGSDKGKDGVVLVYRELVVPVIRSEETAGRRKKGKAKRLGEGGREVPGA
ncbi:hypothetical protein L486_07432 [Kwoniella mangroviensis CBS 10435]|uniref:TRIP4/RQT4 C2HC5-type zinc finger domain-containing protein n=1 Tax=Kwoniella mangroviensis CBS 10435 TaxID=1331196 RepID=A0A1B9IIM1_9TREE|nr:hypothetical protein L486_07432 [Kwoniella mangroviensis CBS 10435]OCF71956.1 hypothetical protein I204_07219 [Kwoniella mangroviensis CBS 8886]